MAKDEQSIIIIKKKKGHGHGHHGGGWKVALADFMTALMAFFLLMWVIASTTPAEKEAIAGYFKDPGNTFVIGPGGADSSVIDMEETQRQADPADNQTEEAVEPGRNQSRDITTDERGAAGTESDQDKKQSSTALDQNVLEKEMQKQEKEQLEALQKQLANEINKADSVFQELKDQIMIDFTALGLRIQIVDKEQRPMFDLGSAKLKPYSNEVLKALAPILNKVPNHLSITGHTDAKPYGLGATYSNWELSADRANAARRALVTGGYPEAKVSTVQGMGSIAPFKADEPTADINRRIAIIVLKKAISDALSNGTSGIPSSSLIGTPEPAKVIEAAEPAAYHKL